MRLLRFLRAGLAAGFCAAAAANPAVHAVEPIRLALIEGLSGPFGNAGDAVARNLQWAVERVNQRGGVALPGGARPLELWRLDSKGQVEEALSMLRAATDRGAGIVLQGNSSSVAAALVDAIDKHNRRAPDRRALLLNYSAVDPALTNAACNYWHFRFDAHADMRLAALVEVLKADRALQRLYLIGQDYSFGQHVLREARARIGADRPDLRIVGEDLHPVGRVKDFLPYATKIKASGAQAVLTGNWGQDLTLLARALREVGADVRLYTFYGNALGAPAAIGEAGIGRVLAVAEWHPNVAGESSAAFYRAFRQRFPDPKDDYVHLRMHAMVEMLAAAIERAGSAEAGAIAAALEGARFDGRRIGLAHEAWMRADDHQLIQPLVVSVMDRAGTPGIANDVEGSGYGFRTLLRLDAARQAMPHTCRMQRPD